MKSRCGAFVVASEWIDRHECNHSDATMEVVFSTSAGWRSSEGYSREAGAVLICVQRGRVHSDVLKISCVTSALMGSTIVTDRLVQVPLHGLIADITMLKDTGLTCASPPPFSPQGIVQAP